MKADRKETLYVGEASAEINRLRRELEKLKHGIDNIGLEKQKKDYEEKHEARKLEERMARERLDEMRSAERIRKERMEERKIAESEAQEKIKLLEIRCEELEKQIQSMKQRKKQILYVASGVVTVAAGIGYYYGTAFAYGMAAGTGLGAVMIVLLAYHAIP